MYPLGKIHQRQADRFGTFSPGARSVFGHKALENYQLTKYFMLDVFEALTLLLLRFAEANAPLLFPDAECLLQTPHILAIVPLVSQLLQPLTYPGGTLSSDPEELLVQDSQAIGNISQHFRAVA